MADRVKRSEVDLGLFRQRRVSPQAPEGQWSRESRAARVSHRHSVQRSRTAEDQQTAWSCRVRIV